MSADQQGDFASLSLGEHDLPDDSSTDSSELFDRTQESRSSKGSDFDVVISLETGNFGQQGPSKQKQLSALRYCIELLTRLDRPEIISATGDILRM
mmetsp:Transcript_31580/g.71037  ORF Transcript_31580/g.71037 Transcript_31580/m.71037 type:complete len:96 (-) Transcript_31580:71-358(-)|eukprot:768263-Hanusia_phi.AAC.5